MRQRCASPVRRVRHRRAGRGTGLLSVLLLLAGWGCPDNQDSQGGEAAGAVEDVTITVEADKSRILEQEQALRENQDAIRGEQERLFEARDSIAKQLESISKKDRKTRLKLEQEEDRIAAEEKKMRDRLRNFESERGKLEREKTELLERISTLARAGGGGGSDNLENREARVAQREQDLARRETRLTDRQKDVQRLHDEAEKSLAQINRILADLQGGGGITRTVVVNAPASVAAAGDPAAAKGQVLKFQKQVQAKMEAKGILVADLPPAAREQQANSVKAIGAKDFDAALTALTELDTVVSNTKVDHAFVQAKFRRINKDYEGKMKTLDEKRKGKVLALLDEVSDSFSDGRYDRANRMINQIHTILESI